MLAVASLCFTVALKDARTNGGINNLSSARRGEFDAAVMLDDEAADMNNTTTQSRVDDYLEDKTHAITSSGGILDGIGGIGGIVGDVGDIFSSILGGGDKTTAPVSTYPVNTDNAAYINPVPAVTYIQNQTTAATVKDTASVVTVTQAVQSDTVDFSAGANPYTKPTGEIKPGDSGEGVKWMQWMFIYTNYGLAGKNVTGVYDADTQELVKKLQQENGLTEDGIVNDAVIDKIELLYYAHTLTATTQTPSDIITAPDTIGMTQGSTDDGSGTNSVAIVVAIIAGIWCVAIAAIIVIFVLKKKKGKKSKNAEKDATESAEPTGNSADESTEEKPQDKVMSLSDLFEEAENKK